MASIPNPPDPDQGAGGPASPDDHVTFSRAEYEALCARIESLSSTPSRIADTDDPGCTDSQSESTGRALDIHTDAEIASRDRRLIDLEQTCKAAVRDRELATALAGRPLVAGAAAQLIKLWRDDLDVFEGETGYQVATRDGRTIAQAVTEWLASPEYSHFSLPTSRGGTGVRDSTRPANHATTTGSPRNLGEAVVMKWREEAASRTDNLLKPIGLRRCR
jgi:hypothetical protein